MTYNPWDPNDPAWSIARDIERLQRLAEPHADVLRQVEKHLESISTGATLLTASDQLRTIEAYQEQAVKLAQGAADQLRTVDLLSQTASDQIHAIEGYQEQAAKLALGPADQLRTSNLLFQTVSDQAHAIEGYQAQMAKVALGSADQLRTIEAYQAQAAKLAIGFSAQDYLNELSRLIPSYPDIASDQYKHEAQILEAAQLALKVAVSPLPQIDFTAYADIYKFEQSALSGMLERINVAIATADFAGEAPFVADKEEAEGEETADPSKVPIEERLIEVVPASALNRLKTVEFLPLSMLDRILRSPDAMKSLTSRDFEKFIATLVDQLGFENVIITPRSSDFGRDILATKTVHGISVLFAFECKRYSTENPVGPEILRALLGTITHGPTKANKGVLVTTSNFTPGARKFILTEPSLDGKDFHGILAWLKAYSNQARRP
jgi:hypothetical protein